jgi:hypothetical protein
MIIMIHDDHIPHPAFEYGPDRGFRNVGKTQSDAGEIPKRTYTKLALLFKKYTTLETNITQVYV